MKEDEMRKILVKKLWPDYCRMFNCKYFYGKKCRACNINMISQKESRTIDWQNLLPSGVDKDYIPMEAVCGFQTLEELVSLDSREFIMYFNHFIDLYEELRLQSLLQKVERIYFPDKKEPIFDYEEGVRLTQYDFRENMQNTNLESLHFVSLNVRFSNEFRRLIGKCKILYKFKFEKEADENIIAVAENIEGRVVFLLRLDELYRKNLIPSDELKKEKESWNIGISERQKLALKQAKEVSDILDIQYGICFKEGGIVIDKDKMRTRTKLIDEILKKARTDIGRNGLLKKIFVDISFEEVWREVEDKILGPYNISNSLSNKKKCCFSSDYFFDKCIEELKKYPEIDN